MSGARFRAVQWNCRKIVYDATVLACVIAFVTVFLAVASSMNPPKNAEEAIGLRIQAFGICAFLMLTVILSIGPLTRLDRRFLPLLYNRRHLGVLTFCVVLVHVWFMIDWYLVQNALPNLGNELTDWASYGKFVGFPFKVLGIAALLIMFLMAATSHDYWLAFLTPRIWKGMHMAIYVAFGLVVMHVALGAMQDAVQTPFALIMLIAAFGTVTTLHILASRRERAADRGIRTGYDGWLSVCHALSIPDKGARIVASPGGERIAVFRDGNRISAMTNLCAHQNGPIGEGCIIDGLVTCPWHGFQYRLEDGCSPPPYTEKLTTHRVRINRGVVEVDPRPLLPGTPVAIECVL
jgi:nitrite reductase/ring-hydroxylating ferredoxin subunit/DMSO/TMAO reductase YedYZ heme-binding membrane subunit